MNQVLEKKTICNKKLIRSVQVIQVTNFNRVQASAISENHVKTGTSVRLEFCSLTDKQTDIHTYRKHTQRQTHTQTN